MVISPKSASVKTKTIPSSTDIVQAHDLTDAETRVLVLLAQYSRRHGWCWITQAKLAIQVNKKARTIRDIIRALWVKGWITTAVVSDPDDIVKTFRQTLWKSEGVSLDGRCLICQVHRPEDRPPDEWRQKLRKDPNDIPF